MRSNFLLPWHWDGSTGTVPQRDPVCSQLCGHRTGSRGVLQGQDLATKPTAAPLEEVASEHFPQSLHHTGTEAQAGHHDETPLQWCQPESGGAWLRKLVLQLELGPQIPLGVNQGSTPARDYIQLVLWVLSTAVSVLQRRHRPDGVLHRHQDRVPAAEGHGRGGHPGHRVPPPHRQVGARGTLPLAGCCWVPSLGGGIGGSVGTGKTKRCGG